MNILLIGAGFSRNWGGWLASELTGDILSRIGDDGELRKNLQATHAFESVLAKVQSDRASSPAHEARYQRLLNAVIESFYAMNLSFSENGFKFNWSQERDMSVSLFLSRFDAIFSLNQDLLLELHYRQTPELPSVQPYYPGLYNHISTDALPIEVDLRQILRRQREPLLEENFLLSDGQPIFKLHGSVDWIQSGKGLLILGGQKADAIHENPLLRWYYEKLRAFLNSGSTRLMVIGYSFQDNHVNDLIWTAAEHHNLEMFLVDPTGLNLLQPHGKGAQFGNRWTTGDIPLIGVSQRPLSSTFNADKLEFGKLMRFFRSLELRT